MSVRNNENRLGHREPSDSSPVPQAQQAAQSSPFSFVVPTEFVTLPSKGKYYPEGHPLHGVEVIEVSHMTAKEEDILTSKSLLRKGVAIDRLLQSVIVDKRVDPNGLLIGDKNAIIVATRIHAYGEDYETKVTCPACGTTSNYGFDLSQIGFDFEEDLSGDWSGHRHTLRLKNLFQSTPGIAVPNYRNERRSSTPRVSLSALLRAIPDFENVLFR